MQHLLANAMQFEAPHGAGTTETEAADAASLKI